MPETDPAGPATVESPASGPEMEAGGLMVRLAGLGRLCHAELREEWRRLFRSQPPKRISRDVLELGVAWKLQERALGVLNRTAGRKLSTLAASLRATGGHRAAALRHPQAGRAAAELRPVRARGGRRADR